MKSASILHRLKPLIVVIAFSGIMACSTESKQSQPAEEAPNVVATSQTASTSVPVPTPTPFPAVVLNNAIPSDDRIRIPSLLIDSAIKSSTVPPNGQLEGPVLGVLLYDFRNFSGFGGSIGSGNALLAGGRIGGGSPSVLYRLGEISPGEAIELYSGGNLYAYSVNSVCWVTRDEYYRSFERLISRTSRPTLTLMTLAGAILPNSRTSSEWSHRLIVTASTNATSTPCVLGSTERPTSEAGCGPEFGAQAAPGTYVRLADGLTPADRDFVVRGVEDARRFVQIALGGFGGPICLDIGVGQGVASAINNVITVHTQPGNPAGLQELAAHEFIHVWQEATALLADDPGPHWLDEGLADYLGIWIAVNRTATVTPTSKLSTTATVTEVLKQRALRAPRPALASLEVLIDAELNYSYADLAVQYLLSIAPIGSVRTYYQARGARLSASDSFAIAFGLTKEEFYRQFQVYADKGFPTDDKGLPVRQ